MGVATAELVAAVKLRLVASEQEHAATKTTTEEKYESRGKQTLSSISVIVTGLPADSLHTLPDFLIL